MELPRRRPSFGISINCLPVNEFPEALDESKPIACNPCHRLPKRLSCCDCIYLVKAGCLPTCGLTGQMIPFPNLHVCGRCTMLSSGSGELCRRCCGEDGNCGGPGGEKKDCCNSGASCHEECGGHSKNDIWCHMRCNNGNTLANHSSGFCRRCCDEDGNCGPIEEECKCCRTVQQRMNF